MAIKFLKYPENSIIDEGQISFTNSNIVSIVGINGSGKTILMNHIKKEFNNKRVEQFVLKEDLENIEKELKTIFSIGKDHKKFTEFINDVKEDGMKKTSDVLAKLDTFIWDRFKNSYEAAIENNFSSETIIKIWDEYDWLKKDNFFNLETIKSSLPEIVDFVKFKKFQESSNLLQKIWKKQFGNPNLITIDMNKEVILNGDVYRNGIGEPSLAESLRNNQILFYRLLNVANIDNEEYKKIINDGLDISPQAKERISNWFKSYVSQEIEISLELNESYYNIKFYEDDTQIAFQDLSSGAQNLLKIVSQIKALNSETIIQIDEPENGMHPMMQIQFRDFLEDLSRTTKSRFIIYTHSNHIVKNGIDTKGLHVIARRNRISKLYTKQEYTNNQNILDIQIFENIGYESLENNYNFDKSKSIIIVEGETDVIYLKKMAKLLGVDVNITRTKIGGASNICKTKVLLGSVHGFISEKIILSPDKDIEEKFPKTFNEIKDSNYHPLGTNERKEIEGFFSVEDKKYIVGLSANKNKKMNRANLFWREVNSLSQLSSQTIENFKKYFRLIGLL